MFARVLCILPTSGTTMKMRRASTISIGRSFQEKRGQEVCGYSIFTDDKGRPNIHVMESGHIDEIKKMVLARMKNSPTPWTNPLFEPEMRKKTVVRRHWKMEPMSAEIAQAIEHEERTEAGDVISKEETDKLMDEILNNADLPEPGSEEGKKLSAELDALAMKQE